MIHKLYSVFDVKTQVFCKPFYAENDATALRGFTYAANDKTTDIGRWPEDYSLFFLGSFDDSDCTIVTVTAPLSIAHAIALVNKE